MTETLPKHYRVYEVPNEFGVILRVDKWIAVRETPRGYWIKHEWCPTWYSDAQARKASYLKWVSKDSERRYAHPDFSAALYSLYRRKLHQAHRIRFTLSVADLIVDKFDTIKDVGPEKIQSLNLGKPDLFSELTWE